MDSGVGRKLIVALGLLLLIVLAIFLWNHVSLQVPLQEILASDHRNRDVQAAVHFGNYLQPSVLTFDLQEVSGERSPADVFRILLQFAAAVRDRQFTRVQLAYRGEVKFILDGEYFKRLGQEYGAQNPVFTMRTFPENLLLPNGERAYGTWTGGWLGVTGKQIEDFNDFHHRWYVAEVAPAQ